MMDPADKDTNHIKDQRTGTGGYFKYTKRKKKARWTNLKWGTEMINTIVVRKLEKQDVRNLLCQRQQNIAGNENRNKQKGALQVIKINEHQGQVKTVRTKPNDKNQVY